MAGKSKKTTDAEIALRVQEIQRAIIQGFTRSDIHAYCRKKWNIRSHRTMDKYFNAACDIIREDGKAEVDDYRAEQVARLKDVVRTLSASLWRQEKEKDTEGNVVKDPVTGKARTVKVPRDTTMRFWLQTVRHLSRITGIETISIDDPGKMTTEEIKEFLTDFFQKLDDDS